jgi:hypothetical protein
MGGLYYQSEASHIVDYALWRLDGSAEFFRGPAMVLSPGRYVSYVGAAQTFGTFCRHPFPDLVTERVGGAAVNLGIGGAGPDRFLRDARLLEVINRGRVAVVQVMSGRSTPNRLYENLDGTSSLRLRTEPKGPWRWAEGVWEEIFRTLPPAEIEGLLADSRANWLSSMRQLLCAITVPKILLWISTRTPSHVFTMDSWQQALGPFPHLVDETLMADIRPLADRYVEVVTRRGLPQRLHDRFTGEWTAVNRLDRQGVRINNGYPSPEAHVDVAEALTPVLREMLAA